MMLVELQSSRKGLFSAVLCSLEEEIYLTLFHIALKRALAAQCIVIKARCQQGKTVVKGTSSSAESKKKGKRCL
jgi:hypothetical protein